MEQFNGNNKLIIIYAIKTLNDKNHKGLLKVGYTSMLATNNRNDLRPNSPYLLNGALHRTQQYMKTAGFNPLHKGHTLPKNQYKNGIKVLYYDIAWVEVAYSKRTNEFFDDHPVHRVLKNSHCTNVAGNEWYKATVTEVKHAIRAVKDGKSRIKRISEPTYFRPEQKDFIDQTINHFKHHNKDSKTMLWNAKMRFGKTLCALEVAKKLKYKHILIITHRPVVNKGWHHWFKKIFMDKPNYVYTSYDSNNQSKQSLKQLINNKTNFFYFVSLQYLVNKRSNGKIKKLLYQIHWDLLIIDEAHEGAVTDKAKDVISHISNDRQLLLSGTPFKLLPELNSDQVLSWDYNNEQDAKENWSSKYGKDDNPYSTMPKVILRRLTMGKRLYKYVNDDFYFNFNDFFKVDPHTKKFVNEDDVKAFLHNITEPNNDTNYPYATGKMEESVKNSLWILPKDDVANALKPLLENDPKFGHGAYRIIDLPGLNNNNPINDLNYVKKQINKRPDKPTITLTVRKMTLGVTIPEWTAVFFLSDTQSVAEYFQAGFRAQSPAKFYKPKCYIYDFSPNRTLDMVYKLSHYFALRQRNKTTRQYMTTLLHFMPVIDKTGNQMHCLSVDEIIEKVHRNNAEYALNSGFYADTLLDMSKLEHPTDDEKDTLSDLRDISAGKQPTHLHPGSSKLPSHRTSGRTNPTGMNNDKQKAKRREKLIQHDKNVLKSIMARIPLMIYGLNLKNKSNFSINDLLKIDDTSWDEFMPNGITKDIFKHLTKFYSLDSFIEACKLFQKRLQKFDKLDPLIRTKKIAQLISNLRSPDNQTILTPWKTINNHLGHLFGGLSYYTKDYTQPTKYHWVNKPNSIFNNPHIKTLEMSSRTGLYSLYMATSLYYQALKKKQANSTTSINFDDKKKLWKQIVCNNIFIIAQTKMAQRVAIRTLIGYDGDHVRDLNIIYKPKLINQTLINDSKKYWKYKCNENEQISKRKSIKAKQRVIDRVTNCKKKYLNDFKKDFGNMKFDVVIGNPPYQKNDKGAKNSAGPIYQYFVDLSEHLSNHYVSLIIPARWYIGGKGLDKFRYKMVNDKHIRSLYDFQTPNDVFPHTEIKGGLAVFLWDKAYNNTNPNSNVDITNVKHHKIINHSVRNLNTDKLNMFIRDPYSDYILPKIPYEKASLESIVSARKPFNLPTTFRKKLSNKGSDNDYLCLANANKKMFYGYISKKAFLNKYNKKHHNVKAINQWKIFTPKENAIGTDAHDNHFQTIIGKPGTICTETYIMIGYNLNLDKNTINNLAKYLRTKFARYLHGLHKISQDATQDTYYFIPMQDFSDNSDIDWSKSISNIDQQLFKKYGLSQKECKHIDESIKGNAQ